MHIIQCDLHIITESLRPDQMTLRPATIVYRVNSTGRNQYVIISSPCLQQSKMIIKQLLLTKVVLHFYMDGKKEDRRNYSQHMKIYIYTVDQIRNKQTSMLYKYKWQRQWLPKRVYHICAGTQHLKFTDKKSIYMEMPTPLTPPPFLWGH